MRKWHDDITFILRRLKNQKMFHAAKEFMLEGLWDTLLEKIREQAEKNKARGKESGERMIQVCEAIECIPLKIKRYVLQRFRKQM